MSGQLNVVAGYDWKRELKLLSDSKDRTLTQGEMAELAVTTAKLDLTTQPTATVAANSIGKREVIASEVQKLGAPVTGGLRGSFVAANPIVVADALFLGLVDVPGATAGMVPVPVPMADDLIISGYVSAAGKVSLLAIFLTGTSHVIRKGTTILIQVI